MKENAPNTAKSNEPVPAYRDTFVHFLFGSPGNESILLHFLNAVYRTACLDNRILRHGNVIM